ncbi:MAG TPA: AAA family ATPase [Ktedonobacterales bacterium]
MLLSQYRAQIGLTQEQLSERAKVGLTTISDIERGISETPRASTAVALADGLGLGPAERKRLLAARVTPRIDIERSEGTPLTRPDTLPLIGRVSEQARIEQLLAGSAAPMLLFYGEQGIGKTRLLRAAEERARRSGWTALYGGSQQSDGQHPYAPIAQALQVCLAGLPLARRRELLKDCESMSQFAPDMLDAQAPVPSWKATSGRERHFMFAAVARFLSRVAYPNGVLLVLDDLQWAEPDALNLLVTLLRSARTSSPLARLRVVAASHDVRSQARRALSRAMTELQRDDLAISHTVGPLTAGDASALLRAALTGAEGLHGPNGDAVLQSVLARSRGVPLYLMRFARELRSSTHDGALTPADIRIPSTITEMIRQRISGLPTAARDALEVAAIYGRDTPLTMLATVAGLSQAQVVEAVEAAYAAHVLVETEAAECRFADDLTREVTLNDLSAARASLLHQKIAEALETHAGHTPVDALAYHFARSGDTLKALLYLERAGDHAAAMRASAAAERFYRDALGRLQPHDQEPTRGRLQEKLGDVLLGSGQYEAARDTLEAAAIAHQRIGDRDGVGRVVAQIGWAHVRGNTAEAGLRRVAPLLSPSALAYLTLPTQVTLWRAFAVLQFTQNRYGEQLTSARRAFLLAREANDATAQAQALRLQGLALVLLGRLDEAESVLRDTIGLSELVGDLDSLSAALNDSAALYRAQGALTTSWEFSGRALQVASQLGDPMGLAFLTSSHGEDAFLLGRWSAARENFEQAVAIARGIGESWAAPYPMMNLGQLCLAEGQELEGVRWLRESLKLAELGNDIQAQRIAQVALAERDLLRGAPLEALRRLEPLFDNSTIDEKDSTALLPMLAWAQLSLGDVPQARASLDVCMRRAEATNVRLVIADALLSRARLSMSQGAWTQADETLEAALVLAREMAYPHLEAKALSLRGTLHMRCGRRPAARQAFRAALAIFNELGERYYAPLTATMLQSVASDSGALA